MKIIAGDESKVMLDAHSEAGFVVGTPFSAPGLYDFAKHGKLTRQVRHKSFVGFRASITSKSSSKKLRPSLMSVQT